VTSLDFTQNDLVSLGPMVFMTSLPSLVDLKLRRNRIVEIVMTSSSSALGDHATWNAPALQSLDLAENHLTTLMRGAFVGVGRLLHLDLSSNQLTDVEGAFDGLKDLSRFVYLIYPGLFTGSIQVSLPDLSRFVYRIYPGLFTGSIQIRLPDLSRLVYRIYPGLFTGSIQVCSYDSKLNFYIGKEILAMYGHIQLSMPTTVGIEKGNSGNV